MLAKFCFCMITVAQIKAIFLRHVFKKIYIYIVVIIKNVTADIELFLNYFEDVFNFFYWYFIKIAYTKPIKKWNCGILLKFINV